MISIEYLTVAYSSTQNVLNGLSLHMEPQRIHGIVGLNGAGKTTFLNALYGLLPKKDGEISYNSNALTKKEIAYLVTENHFYSNITGHDYLMLFKNKDFLVDKWNQLFDLPLDKVVDAYSTGMRKKLALMGILKQDKPIMVLDEPFNGLDLETCRNIRSILLGLKEKGKTIVVTSHILETLTNMCDEIHLLENGIIAQSAQKAGFDAFQEHLFENIENKNKDVLAALFG
jgi:ABC-2 type transport system ATP-binding protein